MSSTKMNHLTLQGHIFVRCRTFSILGQKLVRDKSGNFLFSWSLCANLHASPRSHFPLKYHGQILVYRKRSKRPIFSGDTQIESHFIYEQKTSPIRNSISAASLVYLSNAILGNFTALSIKLTL